MSSFTHFNNQGRAKMVDISEKEATVRIAVAQTSVEVNKETYEQISEGKVKKGDVLAVAQVAGIMAAKKTADWIPMCHPIALSGVDIKFEWEKQEDKYILYISSEVKTKGATGVEMEALTASAATALTVYDMCKAIDKGIIIGQNYLIKKTGGKSGDYLRTKN
jgi:cyclic pyranopterin phosphate synthase